MQRANVVRLETRIVFRPKNGEFDTVESGQAVPGPDPKVAIACLSDRLHRTLGKTVFFAPGIEVVLRDGGRRIKRKRLGRDQDRDGQRQTKPECQGFHGIVSTINDPGRISKHNLGREQLLT